MGHKRDDEQILTAYDGVSIGESDNMLMVSSPFVTKKVLNKGIIEDIIPPFQTEDIVEILSEHEFQLLGRSSNLVKVAGKRISTLQIENIIEAMDGIDAVLIKIRKDERALKDEILEIYVESKKGLDAKVLRAVLKKHFGSMNIAFKIHNGMEITRSSVGKKIGFKEL